MAMTGENADVWYPPGHGDIYASFYNSGLLEQLIAEGKEYIFVSNIDNLGATVDLYILNHLVSQPNGNAASSSWRSQTRPEQMWRWENIICVAYHTVVQNI